MIRVFSRRLYVVLAAIVTLVSFLIIEWAASVPLLVEFASDASLPFTELLSLAATLLLGNILDASFGTTLYVAALSAAGGINIAVFVFFVRMYRAAPSGSSIAGSAAAIVSAILGFGCAACGTVFVTALLATVGGAGIFAALPFGGMELNVIALLLLLYSTYILSRTINKPPVCPI